MGKAEIEYSLRPELVKYRKLAKSGFEIRIRIEPGHKTLKFKGQKSSDKISTLLDYVYESEGISNANQRLFLAGEEIDPDKALSEYCIFGECTLHLKSFLPILVSSMECPGPMLTEIEVFPNYDETVRNVKLRLRDKLGIDVDSQRLYLATGEMTSFPRWRELDDISLLSRYLSPSSGGNFIELRPRSETEHDELAQVITFKLPIMVQDARRSDSSAFLEAKETKSNDGSAQLISLPHTHHKKVTEGWLSLELSTEKIIKRDPSVEDVMKLLLENIKPSGEESKQGNSEIRLKFAKRRLVNGGEYLNEASKCEEHYQIRAYEELLKVEIGGNEPPESEETPTVLIPKPIHPMFSYNEKGTRYTAPKLPTVLKWSIPSSEELDLGANPSVVMEMTAFSHSRLCGSWDVAEHYKTYVEILIEGTFYVGDVMAARSIMTSEDVLVDKKRSAVIYTQDSMEITILGPENGRTAVLSMANESPMRWYRKSAEGRRKDTEFWNQTLDRKLGFAPPFRYDLRPTNLPKRTGVENKEGIFTHSGQSRLVVNNWYTGKEKVTYITPKNHKKPQRIFDANCERGTTISGSPYVKIKFKSRNPKVTCEERCTAFDFRIQTQFYVCTLEDEFSNGKRLESPKQFTISAVQSITRTKYVPNYSTVEKQLTSPANSQMQTTLAIDLANGAWVKEVNKAEVI